MERALGAWKPTGPVHAIALGKAAPSMAASFQKAAGDQFAAGFCACQEGKLPAPWITCIGDHPMPGPRSLAAGEALDRFVQSLPESASVYGLLSGGASALIELPYPESALEDFKALTQRSFAEGWDIVQLNEERAKISQIKGGGLASMLGPRLKRAWIVSDVPLGQEKFVGSGPFWSAQSNAEVLLTRRHAGMAVSAAIPRSLPGAVVVIAQEMGGSVSDWITGVLPKVLATLEPSQAAVFYGELTHSAKPGGLGGRCQHLCLLASKAIAGTGFHLLAGGTDGRDGPTDFAGAIVDGTTFGDGEGWQGAAAGSNSTAWLARKGALIPRFPPATNLNDLIVVLR